MSDRRSDIESVFEGVKVNETRGVVAEEADVCNTALAQFMVIESGADKKLLAISAAMAVHGKFLVFNLHAPFGGSNLVSTLLEQHKRNAAAFFTSNPN